MTQNMRFQEWKEKKTQIIIYYSEDGGITKRHAIGRITDFDDNFLFIRDDKWDKECCISVKKITKIEIYRKKENKKIITKEVNENGK